MKIVNIEEENLHISWKSWEISMKFSGKMWLIKVTKNQGFTLSLKNTFLEKSLEGCQIGFLGLKHQIKEHRCKFKVENLLKVVV